MKKLKKVVATSALLVLSASTVFSSVGHAVSLKEMLNSPSKSYVQSIIEDYENAQNNYVREYTEEEKAEILAAFEGSGTEEDPYIVDSASKLRSMRIALTSYFKLTEDIDLENIEWEPIGDELNPFSGSFDGDGHTIKNVNIKSESIEIGFFGYLQGNVTNVVFDNVKISCSLSDAHIGSVAGEINRFVNISNITVKNIDIYAPYNNNGGVGGIVGYGGLNKFGNIKDVSVIGGKIVGNNHTGGILGRNNTNSSINLINVNSKVDVTGAENIGGICGYANNVAIRSAYSTGNISGTENVGGITGYFGTVTNSYSTGIIEGTKYVGGIVGASGSATYCFSTGKVKGTINVAGIMNDTSTGSTTVNGCYSIAKIEVPKSAIGISAYPISRNLNARINCYWTQEASKITDTTESKVGIFERTLEEMTWQMNYVGWNFDNTWLIDENESTPYLAGLPKPNSVRKELIGKEAPSIATMEVADVELRKLTFNYSAQDAIDGLESLSFYLNGELVKKIKYDTPEKELVEGTVTFEGLKAGTDYQYYMVAKSVNTLERTSDIKSTKTDSLNTPVIELSSTEVSNQGVTVTISANISDKQKIQYRDVTSLSAGLDVYPWMDYTGPIEVWKNKYIYARVTDGNEYSEEVIKVINTIDTKKPEITSSYLDGKIKLSFSDKGKSGIKAFSYAISNKFLKDDEIEYGEENSLETSTEKEITFDKNTQVMYVKAWDKAGNIAYDSFGGTDLDELVDPDVTVEINLSNTKDNSIKIPDSIFNVVVTKQNGEKIETKESTNKNGTIIVKNIKDSDRTTIEFKQAEAANGYDVDNTERRITFQRLEDLETEEIITRVIPEATTEGLDYVISGNKISINIENIMSQDRFNISLNQHYNGDESINVEGTKYSLQEADANTPQFLSLNKTLANEELDEDIEDTPEATTNKYGNAFISLPVKSAGIYTYYIKEVGENTIAATDTELVVTYDADGKVVDCVLNGADENKIKITETDGNFVSIETNKEPETLPVEPYKITVIANSENSNMGVTVSQDKGINAYKSGNTKVVFSDINGYGDINIQIDGYAQNGTTVLNTEKVRVYRNSSNGNFELKKDSDGVTAEVDNEKRTIKILFIGAEDIPDDEPGNLDITSSKYVIDGEYCNRVYDSTTIANFVSNITGNGTIEIYDAKGTKLDNSDTTKFVGTGYKVKVVSGTQSTEKTIVVVGDINGDGKITVADVSAISRAFVKLNSLTKVQEKASDITGDNNFAISDVSKISRFFVKLVDKLF